MESLWVPFFLCIFVKNKIMVDRELKELKFHGKTYYYKVEYDFNESGEKEWTNFYYTNDVSTFRNKYRIFGGPVVMVPANDVIYQIDINIESCKYTKEEVRKKVQRMVDILGRCEQIKNGEII
jgi:hypothetical protein